MPVNLAEQLHAMRPGNKRKKNVSGSFEETWFNLLKAMISKNDRPDRAPTFDSIKERPLIVSGG